MDYNTHTHTETTTVGRGGSSHTVSITSESAAIYDESGRQTPQERLTLHDSQEDDGDGNEIDNDERWVGRANIGGDGSTYGDHSTRHEDEDEDLADTPDDDYEDNDAQWVGSGSVGDDNYDEQEYEDDGYVEPEGDDYDDDAGAYDDEDY